MIRPGWRTALCLLLLAMPAAAQQSVRPAELPEAPQPQMAAVRPPLLSWVRTAPPSTYVALTRRQKLNVFLHYTYAPQTIAGTAFDAAIAQGSSDHEGYGQGWQGYGKRFGASFADNESGVFFQRYLLAALFHQDPRYFRRPELPFLRRAMYAASRVFLTRNDSGHTAFNVSYLAGGLLSTSLANAYYPFYERGLENTMVRFGSGIASDSGLMMLHEFWPDIHARLSSNRLYRKLRHSRLGQKLDPPTEPADR